MLQQPQADSMLRECFDAAMLQLHSSLWLSPGGFLRGSSMDYQWKALVMCGVSSPLQELYSWHETLR